MKTHITTTNLDLTPSLNAYIERKLEALSRLLTRLDEDGGVEVWLWLKRTTKHHHKGPVFKAEADVRLPGKILRASEENFDVRAALDVVKDKLHVEIEKYKTRLRPRSVRKDKNVRTRREE